MSAHVTRHTNDAAEAAPANDVDRDVLDAVLDVRGQAPRPLVALTTTLRVPGSPAVTSPTDHRRR
jgi:hypothetical protein